MDEVGRGPLAGPVVAAAVLLPRDESLPWLSQVRDSKLLSDAKRRELSSSLSQFPHGFGLVSQETIDREGILTATRLAMKQAIEALIPQPDFVLIDALRLPDLGLPQRGLIKGDCLCLSIASASILAKVHRDTWMEQADVLYPGYGFARHKGYGTEEHLAALRRLGPCPLHRHSFAPVKLLL